MIGKEVWLGKISRVRFGMGGYDGAMFGLSVTLSGNGLSVDDFVGTWATYPERAKYTREEWERGHLDATQRLLELLLQSKRRFVEELEGVPVEVTTEGNTLKSWRVLTEVI